MTEKPEASVLTARRAAQHFRLSSADDDCEHLYILTVRASLGPSPPSAGRYTVASRFRCRSCERGYIFPRAPEQFVASPLCLVGCVRWDARADRIPPLQTIIFSSFPGRTPACRPFVQIRWIGQRMERSGTYFSADPGRYAQINRWTDRPRTPIPALRATWGQASRLPAPSLAECSLGIRNRTSRRQ